MITYVIFDMGSILLDTEGYILMSIIKNSKAKLYRY